MGNGLSCRIDSTPQQIGEGQVNYQTRLEQHSSQLVLPPSSLAHKGKEAAKERKDPHHESDFLYDYN